MFGLIRKIFIGLLSSMVNAFNNTECVSSSNEICMIQPTLINLLPNEYNLEIYYCPFVVKLNCVGSCNSLNDLSNKVCIPNNTEDLYLTYSIWLEE